MPLLLNLLRAAFLSYAVSKIFKVFGIVLIYFYGWDLLLDYVFGYLKDTMSDNFPLAMMQLLGLFKFDIALNMIFGALTAVGTIKLAKKFGFGLI